MHRCTVKPRPTDLTHIVTGTDNAKCLSLHRWMRVLHLLLLDYRWPLRARLHRREALWSIRIARARVREESILMWLRLLLLRIRGRHWLQQRWRGRGSRGTRRRRPSGGLDSPSQPRIHLCAKHTKAQGQLLYRDVAGHCGREGVQALFAYNVETVLQSCRKDFGQLQ